MSASMARSGMDKAVQKYEETPLEAESRKTAGFPSFEQRLNFKRFSRFDLGSLDRATALLGSRNPFSKKAKASENEVWLLDNTAYRKANSNTGSPEWEAEFVACFFQKGRKDITKAVSQIADTIGLDGKVGQDEDVRKTIAQRLQPFLSPIAPARTISISVPSQAGGPKSYTLGPSNANGISTQIIPISGDDSADGSEITSINDGVESPPASGKTRFAGPEGWTVISDIDDTVKITLSSNPIGIIQTTFAEQPRTTEGMPEFYKTLQQQFRNPAWFYVSASPYNLYPFLHTFIQEHYPPGTIILRDASWMFFGGLLQSLTQGVKDYKAEQIVKINGWLPNRKTICIGDSTQMDPETYAAMYLKYPDWIKAIYIRKVTDAPYMEKKNKDERFTEAFKGVPEHIWKVYTTPIELSDHVQNLANQESAGPADPREG